MNFETYREKIEQLLLSKAKNNMGREAVIKLSEIDTSIRATDDLTLSFVRWLQRCEMIDEACFLGKGCVRCIVKENFI